MEDLDRSGHLCCLFGVFHERSMGASVSEHPEMLIKMMGGLGLLCQLFTYERTGDTEGPDPLSQKIHDYCGYRFP